MKSAYLDWNIFTAIEKVDDPTFKERETFSKIEEAIKSGKLLTPYSNAHINDIVRGSLKNDFYIPLHLKTLKRLTKDLCITQYWNFKNATWHIRPVEEFYQTAKDDAETIPQSFSQLIDWDTTGLWTMNLLLMRSQKLPGTWLQIYDADPIFDFIFPLSKREPNVLMLCEDLYSFSFNARKDFKLYKSLRSFVNKHRGKLQNQESTIDKMERALGGTPEHLKFDNTWEKLSAQNKTSANPIYQRVTDTYYKIDFRGYKSDEKFENMIDDSLHVFYGAHCNYFVTIDDRCHYKATETYKELGIKTVVCKPLDFINSNYEV
jgi:hypothetical protein